ncbi:MAG: hypothetical protein LBV09_07050 [Deferribacteraceae bacterium]|jgi:hypothetical protein|nr:hypothetical protein [Deferribacteraceae bacterium]
MESIKEITQILEQIQSGIDRDRGSAAPKGNNPSIVVQFFLKEVNTVNVLDGAYSCKEE